VDYVNLGNTGIKVSRICLGCMTYGSKSWRDWILEEDESRPFIERALERGITFFDTADVYSLGASEEILGRAIRDLASDREDVVIATKVYNPMGDDPNARGLSAKHIRHAIDASLTRLGMEYVDLYQIHRFDDETPIEETCEALDAVVKSGKALHIGASSMYAWQMAKMLDYQERNGLARFVTMQNHYNLIYREEEREMIPLCSDRGIGLIPWSPLARGMLAGNRKAQTTRSKTDDFGNAMYTSDTDDAVVGAVEAVAKRLDVSPAQVALAWVLAQPDVSAPIVGASKMGHLDDAIAALDVELSDDDHDELEAPYAPHPVLGHG